MSKNTVLVGGGTGFIGSYLCRHLRDKNYPVRVISRMPGPNRLTWHDIDKKGIPEGTYAVINVSGQNVLNPLSRWTTGFKHNVWNSRIRTTAALTHAIINAVEKPKVYVTIGGVGLYKPDPVRVYTEECKGEEFDYFSKLNLEWEKAAKLPENMSECRQITIRSGAVLGIRGGMIKSLYWPFFFGLGGPVGSGTQYLPWIHIDDLTGLIIFAMKKEGLRGILNGVAPQTITNEQFATAFAKAMRRPAFIPLPVAILNMIFNAERAKMITEGQKVIPQRTQAVGFTFTYPDIKSACENVLSTL